MHYPTWRTCKTSKTQIVDPVLRLMYKTVWSLFGIIESYKIPILQEEHDASNFQHVSKRSEPFRWQSYKIFIILLML